MVPSTPGRCARRTGAPTGRPARSNHSLTLAPGTVMVLYTDGLVERRGVSLDAGLTELTEALRDRQQLTAEELCDHLLAHFGADTEDDIVLTVIRADPH